MEFSPAQLNRRVRRVRGTRLQQLLVEPKASRWRIKSNNSIVACYKDIEISPKGAGVFISS